MRPGGRVPVGLDARFCPTTDLPSKTSESRNHPRHRARAISINARNPMNWNGVMPAITTCFDANLQVDHAFVAKHCRWLLENGCTGIVALGSLGEGATLTFPEKVQILKACVAAADGRAPVVASVSALSTSEAVALAKEAAEAGCDGLMVLPPYVYQGDWREMKTHVAAVFRATPLSCMLYNNPVAYGTDFLPEHIKELT